MPRFFCDPAVDGKLTITGEDAQHIAKVLRMKAGELITASCSDGTDCESVIETVSSQEVVLNVLSSAPNQTEPSLQLTLYQALPKGDKMEFIIQKAIELGAIKIIPMLTKRCISRPDSKSMEKKIIRFQKIAKEAAKQCGRGKIPKIGNLMSFGQVLSDCRQYDKALICYEKGGGRINSLLSKEDKNIALLIGSEGGFEAEEITAAEQSGIFPTTLGKLILRCETAPLAAISIIMNLTENI